MRFLVPEASQLTPQCDAKGSDPILASVQRLPALRTPRPLESFRGGD
jgi:hypothetical protein